MKDQIIDCLYRTEMLSPLDIHFADLVARLDGRRIPDVLLAAALVSTYTRSGHICTELGRLAGRPWHEAEKGEKLFTFPELDDWVDCLRTSPAVGYPDEYKPLILDNSARLYLYRYWHYQQQLARAIQERAADSGDTVDFQLLKERLARLFPTDKPKEIDWQKVGACAALRKRFCVISGGPGTGKTSTVARILALLLEQSSPTKLRICLAASTGKAAARLQEAIGRVKDTLDCPENIKGAIPEEASTIHRLLGSIPASPYFRHNQTNPLRVDVVVIDEASMVDLALMAKLAQALPQQARLILLGDKDQLASVEAGAVLGDICDTGNVHGFSERFSSFVQDVTGYAVPGDPGGESESGLQDCIVLLRKSYRFGADSGIGAVSQHVNRGEGDRAMSILRDSRCLDVTWKNLPEASALAKAVGRLIVDGFAPCLQASEPLEILRQFDCFRILCALREGPYGVVALNSLVERILKEHNLIEPDKRWYSGRPVMITRNDYQLRLFNGDIGIALPDPKADNDLRVFFNSAEGALRRFHPLRIPEHETVFAMTVHKSQGSEFDEVLLLLPNRESPVLTRELIYTGISRARKRLEIWAPEAVFQIAVSRRIQRTSGLRDALWNSQGA